ncbi:MAG: hypothetical protein ACRDRP_19770 [Pseudonocardiaceae bacterium]
MNSKHGREPGHYPDGLRSSLEGSAEHAIEGLISKLDVAAMTKPRPNSALLDGTSAQRRCRRRARRCAAAVVRALPARCAADDPDGWAA